MRGSGPTGRGSVWDDEEVVVMDGGGRCRIVNVPIATESYPKMCLMLSVVCQLHHNRKEVSQENRVSQEAGAIASARRAGILYLSSHSQALPLVGD